MPLMQVELDPQVLVWVEEISLHVDFLGNDALLLELALEELQDFYQETYRNDAPKSLRRALELIKHLSSSVENSIEDLEFKVKRTQTALEASLCGETPP